MDALNHLHFRRRYEPTPTSLRPISSMENTATRRKSPQFLRTIDDKYNCRSRVYIDTYIYIYIFIHTYIAIVTLIQILNIIFKGRSRAFFRLWKFHPEQTDHGAERTAQGECGRSPWMFLRSPLTVVGFLIVCRFLRSRCLCVRMTVMTR